MGKNGRPEIGKRHDRAESEDEAAERDASGNDEEEDEEEDADI